MAQRPLTDEERKRILAKAYAKYLENQGVKPKEIVKIIENMPALNIENEKADNPELVAQAVKQHETITAQQATATAQQTVQEPAQQTVSAINVEQTAVAENAVQPIAEPVAEPVVQAATEPVAEPVVQAATEPVAEPVVEPVVQAATEPLEPLSEKQQKKNLKQQKKEAKKAKKAKKAMSAKGGNKTGKKKKDKNNNKQTDGFGPLGLLGSFLAWLIDKHDVIQERCDDALIYAGHSIGKEYHDAIERYTNSRRRIGISALTITMLCGVMLLVFDQFTVYQYSYNGRALGYVRSQEAVTEVLDVASSNINANNDDVKVKFKADDNITFKLVTAADKSLDTSDEAVNKLAYMTDIEVDAYAIYEDGVLLTIVESQSAAEEALKTVKVTRSVPDEGMKLISSEFNKNVTIEPVSAMLTSIQSEREATKTLLNGGELDIWHVVATNETKKSLCKEYGVTAENILAKDGATEATNIGEGDKVCIKKTVDPLEVKVVEKGTMAEILPFEKITQETDKMYKGMSQVTQTGVDGKQIITGKVTKINDKIVKRKLKKKELINEAIAEITLVGTADIPKTAATGSYMIPTINYIVSSRFGARWGRIHEGVDLAGSVGTPIYAADGGVVTVSGWQSGYGYVIYIDHENGESTRYGHCSKLLVSVGERVYKGQLIAEMGSTGNSTGPHLHFEILVNGEQIDPGPVLGLY